MPMGMMDPKRISIILASKLGDKEDKKEPKMKEEDNMPQPDIAAAKALVAAINDRDFEQVVKAFKNMMECCDMMDSEDDEDME